MCDCVVWAKDVFVYNVAVVTVYTVPFLPCLVSILFILLRVCNAQNVNVFLFVFCILVLLDIHFSTSISVRLFCFLNKSLVCVSECNYCQIAF